VIVNNGYRLRISDSILNLLRGLHPQIKAQIKAGLKLTLDDLYCGKPLKGELEGLRSLRVKRYRIIYRPIIEKKEIDIIAIGPRKIIYEETYRMINK
jgi:mRNA interferase RelE/StbE